MSYEKREIALSDHGAQALRDAQYLTKHNLGLQNEDYAPFQIKWGNEVVGGERSKYILPSLIFKGGKVAQIGFRGTSGFMMVKSGLSDIVAQTCAQTFLRMTDDAKRNARVFKEEQRALTNLFKEEFRVRDRAGHVGPMLDTSLINVINALHASNLPIRASWRSQKHLDVALVSPAYKMQIPCLEVHRYSEDNIIRWHAPEFAVSSVEGREFMSRHRQTIGEEQQRAVCDISLDLGSDRIDPRKIHEGVSRKFRGAPEITEQNGLSLRHLSDRRMVLCHEKMIIASFRHFDFGTPKAPQVGISVEEVADGVSNSKAHHKRLVNAASMLITSGAKVRKEKVLPEEWERSLEAAVVSMDTGYR